MNKIRYAICILFLPVIGCDSVDPKSSETIVPPKGMKVFDLQPSVSSEPLRPIEFQIFVYELPILHLPEYRDLVQSLDRTSVELQDPPGFSNNSLIVGFGQPQIGMNTVRQLESIGGEQISARSLIVFDEKGDDLASLELPLNAEISWRDRTGFEHQQVVGAGRLSWILKSRLVGEIRGIADVRIEPGFRKKADEIGGRMLGHTEIPVQGFPVIAFHSRMGPGDFLLFGPNQIPNNENSLSALLCRSARNPQVRVLVYLVICTRISN